MPVTYAYTVFEVVELYKLKVTAPVLSAGTGFSTGAARTWNLFCVARESLRVVVDMMA
jgi:hypothetical protein